MDSNSGGFIFGLILLAVLCWWGFKRNGDASGKTPAPLPVPKQEEKEPAKKTPLAERQDGANRRAKPEAATPSLRVRDRDGRDLGIMPVSQSPFHIGRHSSCEMHLDNSSISRKHAQIVQDKTGWRIQDCDSANGLLVNGRPTTNARLAEGDRIEIGPFALTFCLLKAQGENRIFDPPPVPDAGLERTTLKDMVEVGRGGMAVVYSARMFPENRQVAVKMPNIQRFDDPEFIMARFEREIRITQSLSHPHIVRVYNHGQFNDGTPYLAMEFLPGGSLRHRIPQGGQIAEVEAARIGTQIADALAYAHARDVVHRDLKPENILFCEAGNAKLTDFGIAWMKGCRQVTSVNARMGTVHYMSPEQTQGQTHLTAASDVYSLGCTVYEMVTGRCPFEGEEQVVLNLCAHKIPDRARVLNPAVSKKLDALLASALAKSPDDRPRSDEMRRQLAGA